MNDYALNPKDCSFTFYGNIFDGEMTETDFTIYVKNLKNKSDDDVRDIDHPDFEKLWGNDCENVFTPWSQEDIEGDLKALDTMTKARAWLISIGMHEVK